MREHFEIEDIEEMRRLQGIDDVELREEVRGLAVGGLVRLTLFLPSKAATRETLTVRITSIKAGAFRGKLVEAPASPTLAGLRAGALLAFNAGHIHSLAEPQQPPRARARR